MAEKNESNGGDRKGKKGPELKVPPRTWLVWMAVISAILVLLLFRDRMEPQGQELSQDSFMQKVESNQIVRATITYDPQSPFLVEIVGKYQSGGSG